MTLNALAQTFTIPKDYSAGAFVTSVAIAFSRVSSTETEPVEVRIVKTLNGYPIKDAMPDASAILSAEYIKNYYQSLGYTLGNTTNLNKKLEFIKFTFPSHVILQPNVEYALYVHTNTKRYKVWAAEMSNVLTIDNRVVDKQPAAGSLFKSQNSSTWTPIQTQDLTFKIYFANFNNGVTGKIALQETPQNKLEMLGQNPIRITASSSTVRVKIPDHGYEVGHKIKLMNVVDVNGSSLTALNNLIFNVTKVTPTHVYFLVPSYSPANTVDTGGGEVYHEPMIKFDKILIQGLDEGRGYGVKVSAKLAASFSKDSEDSNIRYSDLLDLAESKYIHNSLNKVGTNSLDINIELSSTNNKTSPVIDLDLVKFSTIKTSVDDPSKTYIDYSIDKTLLQFSGTVDYAPPAGAELYDRIIANTTFPLHSVKPGAWFKVTNAGAGANQNKEGYIRNVSIRDVSGTDKCVIEVVLESGNFSSVTDSSTLFEWAIYDTFVSETAARGGNTLSKYVGKEVALKTLCSNLKLMFAYNAPKLATFDIYYRVASGKSVAELNWVKYDSTHITSQNKRDFTEGDYTITTTSPFDHFQIKLVMRSPDVISAAKFKQLRVIATV